METLFKISPALAFALICFYARAKSAPWPRDTEYRTSQHILFIWLFSWLICWLPLSSLIYFVIACHKSNLTIYYNLLGIFGVLFIFQICRLWLESKESTGYGNAPFGKAVLDLFNNTLLFYTCYTSTFFVNDIYSFLGIAIAVYIIFTRIYYRIIKDILGYKLYKKSKRYLSVDKNDTEHILLRGILDHIPRAWMYTAFSFSIIDIHLNKAKTAFAITSDTGNELIDYFYFNIVTLATVGYGDIVPKSSLAKITCIFEILFSIYILAALLQLVLGRYQSAVEDNSAPKH